MLFKTTGEVMFIEEIDSQGMLLLAMDAGGATLLVKVGDGIRFFCQFSVILLDFSTIFFSNTI